MDLLVEFDTSQLRRLQGALNRSADIVLEELERFASVTTAAMQGDIVDRTPTSGTGNLRRSIISQVRPVGRLGVEGIVGTSSIYAIPVEEGTKPHPVSREGREALADWAQRKLGVTEKESHRVAFLIARKIGRLGTEGAHMFRDTFAEHQPHIGAALDRCLQRIEERLTAELG